MSDQEGKQYPVENQEPQPEQQQLVVEGIAIGIIDTKGQQAPLETHHGENQPLVNPTPNQQNNQPQYATMNTSMVTKDQNSLLYPTLDLYSYAMANIRIPNDVDFKHIYVIKDPWFSGIYEEYSSFTIPGLGTFDIGYKMIKSFFRYRPFKEVYRPGVFEWNYHFYDEPDYKVVSQLVSMEYWNNGLGVIRVANLPVIEFISAKPNISDALYGHCKSGFPKINLRFPLGGERPQLWLEPDPSPCPESCFSSNSCCSLCGICTDQRNFQVRGIKSGKVSILNTRVCSEACGKVFLCQGRAGYPHVDYPQFYVKFDESVPQIERLAVIMGLIHYSYFKKWYFIAHISHTALGLG